GRRQNAYSGRIFGALVMGPSLLSPLSTSDRDVRHWSGLFIYPATAAPGRVVAQRRLAALAQHHGDQSCYCVRRRRTDLVCRLRTASARAFADHVNRRLNRGVAVLRATPV